MKEEKEKKIREEIKSYLSDGPKPGAMVSLKVKSKHDVSLRDYNLLVRKMKREGVIDTKLSLLVLNKE